MNSIDYRRPKPMKLKKTKFKSKLIPYHQLRDMYIFKYEDPKREEGWVLTKVDDSYSLDNKGKDFILSPTDMVEPLYPVCCSRI